MRGVRLGFFEYIGSQILENSSVAFACPLIRMFHKSNNLLVCTQVTSPLDLLPPLLPFPPPLVPTQQQPSAMVTDGEVPAEEQERLFREQQEYQARYMQMRRAEQQQLEQMRSEHEQQQQQQRGGGSRRRIRDAFSGRRRSMGL